MYANGKFYWVAISHYYHFPSEGEVRERIVLFKFGHVGTHSRPIDTYGIVQAGMGLYHKHEQNA